MKELLELLSERASCEYLSDLPRTYKQALDKKDILNIPDSQYPLEVWNSTLFYLTKTRREYFSVSDAKQSLISQLTGLPRKADL